MESLERLTGGLWRFWITRLLRPPAGRPSKPASGVGGGDGCGVVVTDHAELELTGMPWGNVGADKTKTWVGAVGRR